VFPFLLSLGSLLFRTLLSFTTSICRTSLPSSHKISKVQTSPLLMVSQEKWEIYKNKLGIINLSPTATLSKHRLWKSNNTINNGAQNTQSSSLISNQLTFVLLSIHIFENNAFLIIFPTLANLNIYHNTK